MYRNQIMLKDILLQYDSNSQNFKVYFEVCIAYIYIYLSITTLVTRIVDHNKGSHGGFNYFFPSIILFLQFQVNLSQVIFVFFKFSFF